MLSILILSYNRREALRRTLRELRVGAPAEAQVIVADNGSTDGSVAMVRAEFPAVEALALGANLGVAGFNRAAERARGEMLLILDDDAWPDPAGLAAALAMMDREPAVGGVALAPVHPRTGVAEWRHATAARTRWPFMGCGNLVRTEAWRRVGGYEEAFFLYRNDCDLALKLLAAGWDVVFDPAWVVWHDSPAAARKSERWLRLATRNWVWMTARHGRGPMAALGAAAGAAWALRLAGLDRARLAAAWAGLAEGMTESAPPLPAACAPDGDAYAGMVLTQLGARGRAVSSRGSAAAPASPG